VIGRHVRFDYSGTQACKELKEEAILAAKALDAAHVTDENVKELFQRTKS